MMMTTLVRALCATVVAAFLVAAPATSASADNGCPGDRDSWSTWKDPQGRTVATMESYDIAGSSRNCYALVSRGPYRGIAKYMSLTVCDGDGCRSDAGQYATYAGPIRGEFCVSIYMIVRDPAGNTILRDSTFSGSCN